MIPADIDPTLCSGEPTRDRLDDGFSAPPTLPVPQRAEPSGDPELALTVKSLF